MTARESVLDLKMRMSRSIIGQEAVVERILLTLLANGNLLLEGLPGLAKTRAIKSLARNLEGEFSRIQFTPDLLPADITGSEIYYDEGGHGSFKFQPGPLFGNLILGDEINRAPAKVQAALLEAMEERQITVAGTTRRLPELFMVLATQNPIEQEGTYPLPEAQMDRFLMKVLIDYPDPDSELTVVGLVRGEEMPNGDGPVEEPAPPISQQAIFEGRREIHEVHVSENVARYIIDLISATRHPEGYGEPLAKWIRVGASPRGSIALDKTSRAHAWLNGQDYVTPDDVRTMIHDVLRHRLILSYEASAGGVTPDQVIDELVKQVAVA